MNEKELTKEQEEQKKYCLDRIAECKKTGDFACRGCKYLKGGRCGIDKCFR